MTNPESAEIQVAIADLRKDIDWLQRLLEERRRSISESFEAFKVELTIHLEKLNDAATTIKEIRGTFVTREMYQEQRDELIRRLGILEAHRQNFLGRESVAILVICTVVSISVSLLIAWLKIR